MADDKKNPLGPTGNAVRANLTRLRELRGLTKKELSEAVGNLGRPIPPLGISRIEAGTRRVDADDLMALAVALKVNPSALLLPGGADRDDIIEVTGGGEVTAQRAWIWADGGGPLHLPGERGTIAAGRAMYEAFREYEQGRPYWLVLDLEEEADSRVEPAATPTELRMQSVLLDSFLRAAGYDVTAQDDGKLIVRPKRPEGGEDDGQGLD